MTGPLPISVEGFLIEPFMAKVSKAGPVPAHRPDLGPCWLWEAGQNGNGYGRFWWRGRHLLAHVMAYTVLVGPIPPGLELDHLCRVRHCLCPDHLEPVTPQVNVRRSESEAAARARRTECPAGHPYEGDNLVVYRGSRYCRACMRLAGPRSLERCREEVARLGGEAAVRHGRAAHDNYGCRCGVCTEAKEAYLERRRELRRTPTKATR